MQKRKSESSDEDNYELSKDLFIWNTEFVQFYTWPAFLSSYASNNILCEYQLHH